MNTTPTPTADSLHVQHNGRGILLMGLAFFTFTLVDTIAKLLTDATHPFEVVWFRQAGLLVAAVLIVARRGPRVFRSRHTGLQIARGAMVALASMLFVSGIRFVPLADAVAVSFIAPFVVTIGGAVFLREHVGPHRWAAIAIGFVGVLIVLRPGLGVMQPAMVLVLGSATLFALRQLMSRVIARDDSTATTIVYSAFAGSAVLTLTLPWVWTWPSDPKVWALLAALAVLAGIAEALVFRALEIAEAVVVTPLHYTTIVWASVWGFLVFGQFPDGWTWVGTAIIIATGLYTVHRERLAAKARQG